MKHKNVNGLLIEFLMVMLFFALTAPVLMGMFIAAKSQSEEAMALTDVLLAAQNLADGIYADADSRDEVITLENGYVLRVAVTEEEYSSGMMHRALVTAEDTQGDIVLTLPCSRYFSNGEAGQ